MHGRKALLVLTVSITVTGGAGSGTFVVPLDGGRIKLICFNVPASPTYTYEITDADGYGLDGEGGLIGDSSRVKDIPCAGTNTLAYSLASADGTYLAKLYIELGA